MPKIHRDRGPTYRPTETVETPEEAPRPPVSALKADWVAYAESQGVDTEGLTKEEIIDAVG